MAHIFDGANFFSYNIAQWSQIQVARWRLGDGAKILDEKMLRWRGGAKMKKVAHVAVTSGVSPALLLPGYKTLLENF